MYTYYLRHLSGLSAKPIVYIPPTVEMSHGLAQRQNYAQYDENSSKGSIFPFHTAPDPQFDRCNWNVS